MKYNNQEIIQGFKNKNEAIIQYTYTIMQPMIAKLVSDNSGMEEDIKSLLSFTISEFYIRCTKGKVEARENAKITTYIRGIAGNLWLTELKKRKKIPTRELLNESITSPIDNKIEEEEIKVIVHNLLAQLSDDCIKILQYKYCEKKSHKEIVQLLGISSEGYSKQKLYRCKNYLTKLVEKSPHYKLLRNRFSSKKNNI